MQGGEIWLRAVLFAIWAAGVNLWFQRHTGNGLENPLELLGMTGGASVASMILDRVLKEGENKGLKKILEEKVRSLLRRSVLSTSVLVVLYLGGTMLAATYSSVQIITPKQAEGLKIAVSAIGAEKPLWSQNVSADGKPARRLLATNPFGRDLRLSVQGFVTRTITLYPLTGLMVDPETDLETLPTLLFRPSIDALASLGEQPEGGTFKVFKVTDKACKELGKEKGRHAFMLGTRRMIPSSYQAIWNLELQAKGTRDEELARTMLAWTRPKLFKNDDSALEPGDLVYTVVTTKAGKRKVSAFITVSKDPFQDISLQENESVPPTCKEVS